MVELLGTEQSRETMTSRVYRLLLLHPVRFIQKLLAEHATPRGLGAAAALGVIVGSLPFLGLHTVLVFMLAKKLRLNRIVALGTNQLCMPPFVPAACIEVGYYLSHGSFLTEISTRTLGREALLRFWEWLLGSLIVGPVLSLVVGSAIWLLAWLLLRRQPRTLAAVRPVIVTLAGEGLPKERAAAPP